MIVVPGWLAALTVLAAVLCLAAAVLWCREAIRLRRQQTICVPGQERRR